MCVYLCAALPPPLLAPQWQFNRDMAAALGFTPAAGLSIKGVVTPQISGLTNINNYKGMVANGYSAAVGDNT
jgi:hypothetical protein